MIFHFTGLGHWGRSIANWPVVLPVLCCLLLVFPGCSREPEPLPSVALEVLISELVRVDGRLRLQGSEAPFTGIMIERYSEGELKSRAEIVDGLLHGVLEGWSRGGQLEEREEFVENVSHGVRERWYPDGALQSRAEIVEGQLEGTFLRWHPNGRLAERIEMRDGVPHGDSVAFFASGFLKAYASMTDGKIQHQEFWNDGDRRELPAAMVSGDGTRHEGELGKL